MIYLNPYRFMLGGQTPSLDLQFANLKNLNNVTTGTSPVTFSRASSGTFVGSNGLIQRAVTNFVLRSEEFENASWTRVGITSVAANDQLAPNGTTTADSIAETTGVSEVHNLRQTVSITAGLPYTASCYFKQPTGGRQYGYLTLGPSVSYSGVNPTVFFDLTTGLIISTTNGTSTIQALANGWFRLSLTATPTVTNANAIFTVGFSSLPSVQTYTGDGRVAMTLWGAQFDQFSSVGEYIPTISAINSAPRFDHNPTTGESLGLLVEEQMANQLRWSEDSSQWMTPVNATLTQNATTAPDGTTTADQMLETTVNGLHSQEVTDHVFVAGTTYTYSVFVKSINGRNFEIGFPVGFSTSRFARFNLSTGVVQGTDSGVTARIIAFPNGWYRCIATSTCVTGGGARPANFINNAAFARSYTGDTSSGIFVWGTQLEIASFATSYIPTTSATVTRSADVASITGADFSSFYNQTEGTVCTQATTNSTHGGINGFPRFIAISDGTNNTNIENYFRVLSSYTDAGYAIRVAGAIQAQFDTNNQRNGQGCAISYATNNFAFAVGGTVVNTDTSGSVPTTTQLRIGARADGTQYLNGVIRRLTYWPVRLPNEILQQITS